MDACVKNPLFVSPLHSCRVLRRCVSVTSGERVGCGGCAAGRGLLVVWTGRDGAGAVEEKRSDPKPSFKIS